MKNKVEQVVLSRYKKHIFPDEKFLCGEAEALRKILSENPDYFYKAHDIEHVDSKVSDEYIERTLFCVLEKL